MVLFFDLISIYSNTFVVTVLQKFDTGLTVRIFEASKIEVRFHLGLFIWVQTFPMHHFLNLGKKK